MVLAEIFSTFAASETFFLITAVIALMITHNAKRPILVTTLDVCKSGLDVMQTSSAVVSDDIQLLRDAVSSRMPHGEAD